VGKWGSLGIVAVSVGGELGDIGMWSYIGEVGVVWNRVS